VSTPHINELRQQLLDTLKDLRNRENPMEPDRARAIAQVAGVLVDSAKAEIDYIKATGSDRSDFIEPAAQITTDASGAGLPNGISSITRHRLS
jgi:BioD-like phosphotransacetylase family protein